MLRLDGGVCSDSSTSRSCLRARSRPGARLASPAPDAVPVDRFVSIGLVRPVTVRPLSGVWSRVDSRPVPPCRRPADLAAPRFADLPALPALPRADAALRLPAVVFRAVCFPGRGGFRVCLRRALPLGVFAPAVLRPVLRRAAAVRRAPAPLRAAARAPAPPFRLEGVFFWPFAFRAGFLAISDSLSAYSAGSAALDQTAVSSG